MKVDYLSSILLMFGFIMSLFAYNITEVSFGDIVPSVLIFVLPLILIAFVVSLFKLKHGKIGIIFTVVVLLFCSFGYVRNWLYSIGLTYINIFSLNLQNQIVLFPLWCIVFAILSFLVIKSKREFGKFAIVLNAFALVFVITSVTPVTLHELNAENGEVVASDNITSENPDIYYIILDEYARADVLEECYGYDNSEFINYLEAKGFYVADNSTSNYNTTCLSMPATLNMDYLIKEGHEYAKESWSSNKVSQYLKEQGYKYIYITGNTQIKGMDQDADVYLSYKPQINNFTISFLETTMAWPVYRFCVSLDGVDDMLPNQYREAVLYAFDEAVKIPDDPQSTFAYMHVMIPHPPFIFESDGSPVKNSGYTSLLQEGLLWQPNNPASQFEGHEEGYIKQVAFVNTKVKEVINAIMEKSVGKAIIIVQGDHGIRIQKDRCYDILNVYYFPDGDYSMLYESISPVNSFRVLFNKYLGTDYLLLPDEKRVIE